MENEITNLPEKKPFLKRKVLGMPTFVFLLLSVVIVSAAIYVAMTTDFTKGVNVWFDSGTEEISIVSSGDVGSNTVSCKNGICSTGDIILTNDDTVEHVCDVTTTGDLTTTYTGTGITAEGVATIPAEGSMTFKVDYDGSSEAAGNYPMLTVISCP